MNTNDLTATAHFAQAHAMSDNRPTMDDLTGDLSFQFENMVKCPRGCGARFHFKGDAFNRHVGNTDSCGSVWG